MYTLLRVKIIKEVFYIVNGTFAREVESSTRKMQFEQKNAGPLVVISTAAPHARTELFRRVEGEDWALSTSTEEGEKEGLPCTVRIINYIYTLHTYI